jgi:hypothetical protein
MEYEGLTAHRISYEIVNFIMWLQDAHENEIRQCRTDQETNAYIIIGEHVEILFTYSRDVQNRQRSLIVIKIVETTR